jgi:site-specific recombinase
VLGKGALGTPELWWACAGVLSMAILNVLVSFALAFTMAVRSRSLRPTKVRALVAAILRAVVAHPFGLLWPAAGRDARAQQSGSH